MDTSPLGDCFLNQSDCWKIRYAIPRQKKIRYRYGTESPIEIEGESFLSEPSGESYNLNNQTSYRVFWTATNWFGQDFASSFGTPFFTTYGQFSFSRLANVPINGAQQIINNYGSQGSGGVRVPASDYLQMGNLGSVYEVPFPRNQATAIIPGTLRILNVVNLSNGQSVPPTTTCRFRVFNCSGQTVLDITRDTCPSVTELPCTNENEPLRELILKPELRLLRIPVLPSLRIRTETVDGRICRVAELVYFTPSPIPVGSVEILRICSPPCCSQPPYIEYKCKDGCDCERCPSETCFACESDGIVCCYGEDGSVIKRFSLEEKCEDQELC